jgi:ATP-dependent DNA helicase RecQ
MRAAVASPLGVKRNEEDKMDSAVKPDLDLILRERFQFPAFRPGQREAIEALLEEGRLICIQPTGHGKSLLYQLPAAVFEGMTLVISPLLALMRDQIGQLQERFAIPAASINSDQSDEENQQVRQEVHAGRWRILFVAPEQLDNLETYQFLATLPIDLLVVDEAHCISTWGHDFRPSYRQIMNAVHQFEKVRPALRVLGLTATANRRTEADIVEQFRGSDGRIAAIHREPMDRPNIALRVVPVNGLDDKLSVLSEILGKLEGCGILYCATREQTEIVAGYLSASGHDVVAYHAGLDPDRKRQLQITFTSGSRQVISATNALGMGIDKPDIRFIVHVDVPGSITSYYQEVGRAGRDGQPALGILLFDGRDQEVQRYFIRSAQPTLEDFAKLLATIVADDRGELPNRTGVAVRCGLHPTKVVVVMAELLEQGFVEKRLEGRRQVYARTAKAGVPDLERYERQFQVRTAELEAMLRYGGEQVGCLMQALRVALGDEDAPPCQRCSACMPHQHPKPEITDDDRATARRWMENRELPIPASRSPRMAPGIVLLDGETRGSQFVDFMRQRANAARSHLDDTLLELLAKRLDPLLAAHNFAAVVALPSRTWEQRRAVSESIAAHLSVPVFPDLLVWRQTPHQRQGELLNNDQRRDNVKGKLTVSGKLPDGDILLLDDYYGSAATLREAGRALRKEGDFEHGIVPVAIARVRWRLGASGMI